MPPPACEGKGHCLQPEHLVARVVTERFLDLSAPPTCAADATHDHGAVVGLTGEVNRSGKSGRKGRGRIHEVNGRTQHIRRVAVPRQSPGCRDLESATSLWTPTLSRRTEGSGPWRAVNQCSAETCNRRSHITRERVPVGESGLRRRGRPHVDIRERCTHRQRRASMRGIAAGGHAPHLFVDASSRLLEGHTGRDEREDLGCRWPGIERTFAPPVEVARSDVAHIDAAPVPETFGDAEGHGKRPPNPVPRGQPQQDAGCSLLAILQQATRLTHAVLLALMQMNSGNASNF